MLEVEGKSLSLDNEQEAEAFCKWYLRTSPMEIEFEDEESFKQFLVKRDRRLHVQLDDLSKIQVHKANTTRVKDITYWKIVPFDDPKPLDGEKSFRASTRFNYKDLKELQTRAIYLGQDKDTCYSEVFHRNIQKKNYAELIGRSPEEIEAEFVLPDYEAVEFKVNLSKVLVLTSESSYKALGVPVRVVKDEWFSINQEFDIPTSGQILARIIRNLGYQGILYSSVRNQLKNNLVIFEENTGLLEFEELSRYKLEQMP